MPGQNLCTVGTYRDVTKWPKRDKRPQDGRKSLINFDWLSPYVIERIKAGASFLDSLQEEQGVDAEEYSCKGFTISSAALHRGMYFYDMALRMYDGSMSTVEWTDMLGLLAPVETVQQIKEDVLTGNIDNIETLESRFRDIYDSYAQWKGYDDNEAENDEATEEWKDAIRRDAEREYAMGDVSEKQIAEFLESV
jgi:hypothetical protein